MSIPSHWSRLSLALLVMPMLLTACFRDSTEAVQQQPVARALASPTALITAEPSAPPPSDTPEPTATQAAADQFALTATAIIAEQTQPAAAVTAPGLAVGAVEAAASPIPRATIPPGQDCAHEIRSGETLFQLSLAYGVTVDEIAKASGIANPDRIAVGQQVTIPGCGTTGFIPPPTSVPTPALEPAAAPTVETASQVDIASDDTRSALVAQAQEALLDNAQGDSLGAFSAQLSGTATPSRSYTVQQNDTLFEIAARYGTSVDVLAALNGIADVDNLSTGQVLEIP